MPRCPKKRRRARRATVFCPVCKEQTRRVSVPGTRHDVDVCDAHGTWFDCDEMAAFAESFKERRAGEITDEDLEGAGVPSNGFVSRVFRALLRPL